MFEYQRRDVAGLALVAVCFSLIAYYYFTGLYCSDDTRYLMGAIKIALGEPISTASLAERRVMFLLPAAHAFAPGRNLETLIVPYSLLFVGVGIAGYLLARQLLPKWLAVVSMLVAVAQPVFFLYAGAMLPDLPTTLFLVVALLLLCLWAKASEGPSPRSVARWLAFGIGVCIAVAFTIKESGLVFLPLPVGLMVLSFLPRRRIGALLDLIALAVGFLLILAVEAVVFRLTAGEWFSSLMSLLAPHDFEGFVESQGRSPIARLKTLYMALGPYTSLLFVIAAVASLQLVFEWRSGRLSRWQAYAWLAIAGFWLWPLGYYTFGTASLTHYIPPVIQQRYYAPCIVPAALLAGHLVFVVLRLFRTKSPIGALLAAPVCLLVLWMLGAPYVERKSRGLIYGSDAKESFELARKDAQRRFRGIPVYDLDSGWTTDLNRCRALLMPVLPNGRQRLVEAIGTGDDIQGQFGYPKPGELTPPFLILGHGAFMSSKTPSVWLADLKRQVEAGQIAVTRVGHYDLMSKRALRGLAWLPRTFAVGVVGPISSQWPAPHGSAPEELHSADMYLVAEVGTGDPANTPPRAGAGVAEGGHTARRR